MEYIEFAVDCFDPKHILEVRHNLTDHPLLQLPAFLELAQRLPAKQIRYNTTTTNIHSHIGKAVVDHRHSMGVLDAFANIETSGSWINLMNIESDPAYKALLDEALDSVEDRICAKDPGMFNRVFWAFIQSPGALTPYHVDHEHNFLLQLKGKKLAKIWPNSAVGFSDRAVELFYSDNCQDEMKYRDELAGLCRNIDLVPGVGVYMPSTSPHYVKNTDAVSITISMTYCTKATDQRETIYRGNHFLRKHGITPTPPGRFALKDHLKYWSFKTYLNGRSRLRGEATDIPGWAQK